MADIIRLLPDSVANQIAAGEVIQRPASALKELVENALDAGADKIDIYLRDAGKTSIRIMDNGSGMSVSDARLAFKRHATSKIREANDLFSIQSLGFRGEALASISAISEVVLRTRREEDELGTEISATGIEISAAEQVMCPKGSDFTVRNLFYNVPARRRFLKSDATELNHCVQEFRRIALAHPDKVLTLHHNKTDVYLLPQTNLRQRIGHLFGKHVNAHLIDVETSTSIVSIKGFVTKPAFSRKSFGDQYFFANSRFIRHPFLHKAVVQAYSGLITPDAVPVYYLFLEVSPAAIDINIHPTKTEVKFEDEQSIFHILKAAVREALGKFNIVPSIDFDQEGAPDIPALRYDTEVHIPETRMNPDYNPFRNESHPAYNSGQFSILNSQFPIGDSGFGVQDSGLEVQDSRFEDPMLPLQGGNPAQKAMMQFKGRYIVTSVKSGLILIDQKRAHERILFEQFMQKELTGNAESQQTLFPQSIDLSFDDTQLFDSLEDEFHKLGFEFERESPDRLIVRGIPAHLKNINPRTIIEQVLDQYRTEAFDPDASHKEKMALTLSRVTAIPYDKPLSSEEMQYLTEQLLACSIPHFSPTGQKVIHLVGTEDIKTLFEM